MRGTKGSNPVPSTGESAANFDFLGASAPPSTCTAQRASVTALVARVVPALFERGLGIILDDVAKLRYSGANGTKLIA
jgi:hypothetical protein